MMHDIVAKVDEGGGVKGENGRFFPPLMPLLLLLVALLPRLAALNRYITPDELMWVHRSVVFREALLNGRFADTITTGHPGIITTWLGSLGISLQLLFDPTARAAYQWATHLAWLTPDNMLAFQKLASLLTAGRLAVALANSGGIVAIYLLARRLWGGTVALVLGLLLALDPFVAGLSGLLHVDALMSTLALLALLALALWLQEDKQRWLLLAAILSGLAVLAKSPAILLPPLTALLLGLRLLARREAGWVAGLQTAVRDGLLWLATYLATLLIVLPATWADPARVWGEIGGSASRHVETALRPTFFMGNVTFDHGWTFYPVALLWRLGPLVLLGLLLFGGLLLWQRQQLSRTTMLLALWTLLFWLGISLTAKKFDRYALPLILPLTVLAALAWGWLVAHWRRAWLLPLLLVVQLAYLLPSLPYLLATYNPLLGGAATAEQVLTVGWGEAIGAAGQWLATQPGVTTQTAVSGFPPVLAPFFPGQTLLPNDDSMAQADYIIQTISSVQLAGGSLALPAAAELVHTIRFGGREQGWVYRQSEPMRRETAVSPLPAPVSFDNRVQLWATAARATNEQILLDLGWQLLPGAENGRYTVKLDVGDAQGFTWFGLETPLLNNVYFYPEHWPPNEPTQVRYRLDLPAGMPPGVYTIRLTLFDAATRARLPLLAADGAFQGVFYTVPPVTVPDSKIYSYSELELNRNDVVAALPLRLVGQAALPSSRLSGQTVLLDLLWQADGLLPPDLGLRLGLGEVEAPQTAVSVPLSRHPSQLWQPGTRLHEKYGLPLPPQLAGGTYSLWLQLQTAVGEPQGEPLSLGELEVVATERLFELPPDVATPLALDFGGVVVLRGLSLVQTAVVPGESVELTLFWQAEQQPTAVYTAFLHLIDANDNIVVQSDRWPGGTPSDTWAAGEVIVDQYALSLPPDLPAGQYRLAAGLYTASDGRRLPISDIANGRFAADRALLPGSIVVEP